jgi:hypothetical protein
MYVELRLSATKRIEAYKLGGAQSGSRDLKLYLFMGESEDEVDADDVSAAVEIVKQFAQEPERPLPAR